MEKVISVGFPLPKKEYYKVYVRSITFNQASYIEDCLNGVAMQQTDFPFVHHVIDDCSTDGEQEVIKTYLNNNCDMDNAEYYDNDICSITIAKNKSNPHCTLAVYLLKKNMYRNPEKRKLYKAWQDVCPYEAICEGDDYWIALDKLQVQVDFLERNLDCSLVYTKAKVYNQSKQKFEKRTEGKKIVGFEYLLIKNAIPTVTVMFRSEHLKGYDDFIAGNSWNGIDLSLWLYLSRNHPIHFVNSYTSVYRVTEMSASHFKSYEDDVAFTELMTSIRRFYVSKWCPEKSMSVENQAIRAKMKKAIFYKNKMDAQKYFCQLRNKTLKDFLIYTHFFICK